jgi:hypothetical protein
MQLHYTRDRPAAVGVGEFQRPYRGGTEQLPEVVP